jgi:hypothetical protein
MGVQVQMQLDENTFRQLPMAILTASASALSECLNVVSALNRSSDLSSLDALLTLNLLTQDDQIGVTDLEFSFEIQFKKAGQSSPLQSMVIELQLPHSEEPSPHDEVPSA